MNRKFKIRAVDDNDNSLPDCTVQVYEDQACEKLIKEVNTSLDSDIYNWGSNVPPKGTYYAKVTKVPLGYNIPSNTEFELLGIENEELVITLPRGYFLPSSARNL